MKYIKRSSLLITIILFAVLAFILSMSYVGSNKFEWFAGLYKKDAISKNSLSLETWTYVVVGIGLSIAGSSSQAMTRNPLASAYSLGAIATSILASIIVSYYIPIENEFAEIILTILFCFLFSSVIFFFGLKSKDSARIIVVGLTFSILISSLTYVLRTRLNLTNQIIGFLAMTSFTGTWYKFWVCMPIILLGSIILLTLSNKLNIYRADPIKSITLGIKPERLKIYTSILIMVISASSVILVGPIAFVGIIIPHITKLLFKGSSLRVEILLNIPISIFVLLSSNILYTWLFPYGANLNVILGLIAFPIIILTILRRQHD